ncbi:MAG: peptide chain release factor N(5)-glutamine methyltransferase [Bacteroidia bacterium]|nr:peptide chain release factor N(5)-glutamine methyltransferase [Bacteroidia bacterium]
MNVRDITHFIKSSLKSIYSVNEAESITYLIFQELLNYSKIELHSNRNAKVPNFIILQIKNIVGELKKNKPVQYILGKTEFYNLEIIVTQDVMIPRPETEELVRWIIFESGLISKPLSNKFSLNILDIGTGSGCIAVALAKNLPGSIVYAIDISDKAIKIAELNAKKYNTPVKFIQMDILKTKDLIDCKFDIIVSNPPYIRESEKKKMHKNILDYEPSVALFIKDEQPLIFYEAISSFAKKHLNKNGKLYVELNENMTKKTAELFAKNKYSNIIVNKDINGKPRMLRCER